MGWYGDYDNNEEVAEEIRQDICYSFKGEILEEKVMKTYGIILSKLPDGTVREDAWIFNDGMYKPLSFLYDEHYFTRIPASWHKLFTTEEQKNEIQYQKELIKEKRRNKAKEPKLDDVLKAGFVYEVFGGQYIAKYRFKQKRSFIFELLSGDKKGTLIRFVGLSTKDLNELGTEENYYCSKQPIEQNEL